MVRRLTPLLVALSFALMPPSADSLRAQGYDDPGNGGDANVPPACRGVAATVRIDTVAMAFVPSTITVDPGEPVCWTWATGGVQHNLQADDSSFRSGPPTDSGTFQRSFPAPGSFGYSCQVHGSATGGMRGTVIVRGEEGPPADPQLRLNAAEYLVEEGSPLTVVVERIGPASGAVSVSYDETPGSAKVGADYLRRSGTLKWASGDAAPKSFVVTTKSDQLVEGNESFTVKLSKVKGIPLGTSAASVVVDDEDDCPATGNAGARVTARCDGADSIRISWAAPRDGTASWLERRSPDRPFETVPASLERGHHSDTGLDPATEYEYRLRFEQADGSTVYSATAWAATDGTPRPCRARAGETCLLGGRFAATLRFDGAQGSPDWRAVPGSSSTVVGTGSARDVLLRVDDGCAENGHYGVSVAAAVEADFTVEVRDTTSGRRWLYRGGPSMVAAVDRDAFACGGG